MASLPLFSFQGIGGIEKGDCSHFVLEGEQRAVIDTTRWVSYAIGLDRPAGSAISDLRPDLARDTGA